MFENVEEIRKDGELPVKFYYNREERIKKATKEVQEYYNGGMRPVKGFKSLFYKGNKFIFIALVFFVATVWLYTSLNKNIAYTKIDNLLFDAQCFSHEKQVYANVKIHSKDRDKNSDSVKISVVFNFINSDKQIFKSTELFCDYICDEQYLRTKINDYDIIQVDMIIKVEQEEKIVTTLVTKK